MERTEIGKKTYFINERKRQRWRKKTSLVVVRGKDRETEEEDLLGQDSTEIGR